jgi:DNA-binding NtrC family response regulator
MLPQILLVNPDAPLSASFAPLLSSGGFEVTLAGDFDEAAEVLRRRTFHAVVTAHRLGSYNGLQLVLRARSDRPGVLTVVTSTVRDLQLEAEAAVFGAVCLVAPWQDAARLLEVLRAAGTLPV